MLIFASCNYVQNKKVEPPIPQKPDTTFLTPENLKGNVWVDAFMANRESRQLLQSFINDTVVKYYAGDAPHCWDENYTFWEKYYNCYKIYGDTIEYIAKLVPNSKNDNKYDLSVYSWDRTCMQYKLFIDPDTQDTILLLKSNETIGFEKHNTLNWLIAKKKINYPILLNK